MVRAITLKEHLDQWSENNPTRKNVANVMCAIALGCCEVSRLVAQGSLAGNMAAVRGDNTDGDQQKELDIRANDIITQNLQNQSVRHLISEELDEALNINNGGLLDVAIDPLDGSSNIDTNLSVGTIFSVLKAPKSDALLSLPTGRHQLGGGYVIYGPHTSMVLTVGDGVQIFTMDPETGTFYLTTERVEIPKDTKEFAINGSNFRHWDRYISQYIDDCLAGMQGLRSENYNMRWLASLVAECHRILSRGGIFLYPGDDRPGYGDGRLRLVYEASPIAMLMDQAGGMATTGKNNILDVQATDIHQRTPLIFGSFNEVKRVEQYYLNTNSENSVSPLFSGRGLFRTHK